MSLGQGGRTDPVRVIQVQLGRLLRNHVQFRAQGHKGDADILMFCLPGGGAAHTAPLISSAHQDRQGMAIWRAQRAGDYVRWQGPEWKSSFAVALGCSPVETLVGFPGRSWRESCLATLKGHPVAGQREKPKPKT